MNDINAFVRGEGIGHYKEGAVYHLYRIDLGDVALIIHDYTNYYRRLDVKAERQNNTTFGLYVKNVDFLIVFDMYRFKEIQQDTINFQWMSAENLYDEITEKLAMKFLSYPQVQAALTNKVIDDLYNSNVSNKTYYEQYSKGLKQIEEYKLYSFVTKTRRHVSSIYPYFVEPEIFIHALAEELSVSKEAEYFITRQQQILLYQRYKQFHDEQQTFAKELKAVEILDKTLSKAKNVWLQLKDGQHVQVENRWCIYRDRFIVGPSYSNPKFIEDIISVNYQKKVYPLAAEVEAR